LRNFDDFWLNFWTFCFDISISIAILI
jgi:hypothetical protein